MTIIHNHNKNYRYQSIALNSRRKLSSRNHRRKWKFFVNGASEYLGHIKLTFFFLAPIIIISGFWLLIFGQNISADYKIYSLKNELTQIEDRINFLHEKSANITSTEKIEDWAEENDFVPVKVFSYLDLSNKNLVQR
ncbi:MAG: hypothetical protein PHU82_02115 [Candidatus Pacebacteria bacterium]|jgi:hypothetical protein|nr:hypothetical protein [Candidatus Paceibacterota bacterium]MDD4994816.1 hypothetical protein [Candidatus Paceibacterota bacterium]MDD5535515.1 hypothetical protein [Candidatus Paceibacterota bacterium]